MRALGLVVLAMAAALTAGAAAPGADLASPEPTRPLALAFEKNAGQAKPRVAFVARGVGFRVFLTPKAAAISFARVQASRHRSGLLRLGFVGAAARPRVIGVGRPSGRFALFSGFRRVVAPTYRSVAYRNLYPGIDLVFDGTAGRLQYRFAVARGADPRRISLAFGGATSRRLLPNGDLVLWLRSRSLRITKPVAFQRLDGRRRAVPVRYVLARGGAVRFRLGRYDARRPLVIDPEIVYGATVLGEGTGSFANGVAVDSEGNAHVAGYLARAEFAQESEEFAAPPRNGQGFVAKLSPRGVPLYTTYFDGPGDDFASSIAVDDEGRAYVAGRTDHEGARANAFVARIERNGTPLWIFNLSGESYDEATTVAVDRSGDPYVAGRTTSRDFPSESHGLPRDPDGVDVFVAKLSSRGELVWSTAFGGNGEDDARGIAVDAAGAAYIAGATDNGYGREIVSFYPTTPESFQPERGGGYDAFVTKLSPDGSRLVYSTLLGGDNTQRAYSLAVDDRGRAFVTGITATDFPTTPGAFQRIPDPHTTTFDAFVTRLNATGGGLEYSTLLTGELDEFGSGIDVDADGRAWVTGTSWSESFETTSDALRPTYAGGGDAFVTALDPDGSGAAYSTYLGGGEQEQGNAIAVGDDGSVYPAGITISPDFEGALRTSYDPIWAAYVLRLAPR